MFGGARHPEEVRFGADRQHEMVARERVAVRGRDASRVDVDRNDLGELHAHGLVLAEQPPQWTHHVAGGELGGGHLVQQRLELVIRVLVDERHRDTGVAQAFGAGNTGEPRTDDDDARRGSGLSRRHARGRTVLRPPRPR